MAELISTQPDVNEGSDTVHSIFRYKFNNHFTEILYQFAKIHQYDDRHEFKEAWESWIEENNEDVQNEIDYLTRLNYDGNILDKMFKSARYYFRKKPLEKKEPAKRRPYITVSNELLKAMDTHIELHSLDKEYQPKTGFVDFCNSNKNVLQCAIQEIIQKEFTDIKEIHTKVKKTYKNRYFNIIKNL
jgi:hypothetical protein